MSRRRSLDAAKRDHVCRLIEIGLSLRIAAENVQCSPRTIRREMDRDEDFRYRMNDARHAARQSPWAREQRAASRRLARRHSAPTPTGSVSSASEVDNSALDADISRGGKDSRRLWLVGLFAERFQYHCALQAATRNAS